MRTIVVKRRGKISGLYLAAGIKERNREARKAPVAADPYTGATGSYPWARVERNATAKRQEVEEECTRSLVTIQDGGPLRRCSQPASQ